MINEQIARLRQLSPPALRQEWQRLFRAAAPHFSADLLVRAIAWRLQEKAQGSLAADVRRQLEQLGKTLASRGDLDSF
jgi:hypothetical protein